MVTKADKAVKLTLNQVMNLTASKAKTFGGKQVPVPETFRFAQDEIEEDEARLAVSDILTRANRQGVLKKWKPDSYDKIGFHHFLIGHNDNRATGIKMTREYVAFLEELFPYIKRPYDHQGICYQRRENDELVVIKKNCKPVAFSFPLGTLAE
jgi:hypothetical protein